MDCVIENKFEVSLCVALFLIVISWYYLFWKPVLIEKDLTDIGFDHIPPGPQRYKKVLRAQRSRKTSKVPPPYPNGWFAVAESDVLKKGKVISVDALGQNLCVYRGEDGVARCVDAYCPHLGANLAVGGSVCGNCIECPFHKWRFDEDGSCVSVPEVEHVPKGVTLKTWRTVEADGAVWIWYDAENREPQWEMSDAPELKYMKLRARSEVVFSAHIQEIPENGADAAHINVVHRPSSRLTEKYPFLNVLGHHVWSGGWTKGEGHKSNLKIIQGYQIFNYKIKSMSTTEILINGPSHFRLLSHTFAGPVFIVHSATPIAPMLLRFVRRIYSPWYNAPMALVVMKGEEDQFERDIKIFNWKRFGAMPTLLKTEKDIREFRSWYSQFYSENSVSYKDAMQNTLNW